MRRAFAAWLALSSLSLCLLLPHGAFAAWGADPVAVAAGAGDQRRPQVVYDGSGGYYVSWQETAGSVFAQHYSSAGDASWEAPLLISDSASSYAQQESTADGAGGLLVSWNGTDGYIRAQRVLADGTTAWTAGGVAVINNSEPWIAADGAGGAVVMSYYEVVNRVAADGSLPWGDADTAIPFSSSSYATKIVSDGAGGAILLWEESSAFSGVAVQRIDSEGNFVWNGGAPLQLTADGTSYSCPRLIAQDGGAIVAWYSGTDVMAQKIDGNGVAQWTEGGAVVASSGSYLYDIALAPDGAGGAFITWNDSGSVVMAQHVGADGQAVWADPIAMTTETNLDDLPQHPTYTVSDGQGGFITTWSTTDQEIKAQRIDAAGNLLWSDTGALAATGTDVYYGPKVATNGQGGAVMVWVASRVDTGTDIFLQGVSAEGAAGDPGYTPPASASDSDGGLCFLSSLSQNSATSTASACLLVFTLVAGMLGLATVRRS